jgi:hypothetical protein
MLFDVGFNLNVQTDPLLQSNHAFQNIVATPLEVGFGTTKADLWFNAHDTEEEIGFTLEFNTDLFNQATIKTMISNYVFLLQTITSKRVIKLTDLIIAIDQHESQYLKSEQAKSVSNNFDQLLNISIQSKEL